MGEKVRFDGGHKQSRYCIDTLSQVFNYTKVCPEMAIGMGTPRPTIRLVEKADKGICLVETKDADKDYTQPMKEYAYSCANIIRAVSGFILAKGSPSCGPFRVKIYSEAGNPLDAGKGIFANIVSKIDPLLPIEDEGRLNDLPIRDCFLTRVMIYHEWKHNIINNTALSEPSLVSSQADNESVMTGEALDSSIAATASSRTHNQVSLSKLMDFHAKHKFTILAHCQEIYRKLGPLLGSASKDTADQVASEYITLLMEALSKPASRKNHTNALMHMQGYFKKYLSAEHKAELTEIIDKYRTGVQPLMAPITLLRHYLKEYDVPYLANQSYLKPYPDELMARVIM